MKRKRDGGESTQGTNGMNELPNTTASTAYERRLERRRAERERRMAETMSNTMEGPVEESKKLDVKNKKKLPPYIAFVGQLSYKTTAATVEEYFRNGGVEGSITVRLLTRPNQQQQKKSPKKDKDGHQIESQELSRGMAFLELTSARSLHQCLALHHTRLDGRVINVEKSSGGGKARRKEGIKDLRVKQVSTMSAMVDRLLEKFQQRALLKPDELDADALRVLNKFDGALVERALLEVHLTHNLAFDKGEEGKMGAKTCTEQGLEHKREKLLGETKNIKKIESGKKANGGHLHLSKRKGEKKKQNNEAARSASSCSSSRMLNSVEEEGTGGSNGLSSTSDTNAIVVQSEASPINKKLHGEGGDVIKKNNEAKVVVPSLLNVFPTLRKRGGSKAATRGTRGG